MLKAAVVAAPPLNRMPACPPHLARRLKGRVFPPWGRKNQVWQIAAGKPRSGGKGGGGGGWWRPSGPLFGIAAAPDASPPASSAGDLFLLLLLSFFLDHFTEVLQLELKRTASCGMRDPPGRISSGESPLQRRPLCRPGGLPHALGEAARARVEVEVEGSAAERRRRGRLDVEQLAAGAPIVVVGVDLGGLKSGAEMGLPPTGADPQERPLDVGQARPQQTNSAPLRAPGRGWTWPGRGPW